jgi:hypothetical protein
MRALGHRWSVYLGRRLVDFPWPGVANRTRYITLHVEHSETPQHHQPQAHDPANRMRILRIDDEEDVKVETMLGSHH